MMTNKLLLLIIILLGLNSISHSGMKEAVKAVDNQEWDVAIKELTPEAKKGNTKAQTFLGWLYSSGTGVKQDQEKAFFWYEKAARQKYPAAQMRLARLYFYYTDIDIESGRLLIEIITNIKAETIINWFKESKIPGDTRLYKHIGFYYKNIKNPTDYSEVFKWYEKAALQGDAKSQYLIGALYSLGKGVQEDEIKATEWFKKAALQGDAESQYNLGLQYELGDGANKDIHKAIYWYKMAGENGIAKAQFNLGLIYGNIVDDSIKDLSLSKYWMKKAYKSKDKKIKKKAKKFWNEFELWKY